VHDEDYDGGGDEDETTAAVASRRQRRSDGGADERPRTASRSARDKDKTNDADWWKRGEAPPF
jgi:hypothetical protein